MTIQRKLLRFNLKGIIVLIILFLSLDNTIYNYKLKEDNLLIKKKKEEIMKKKKEAIKIKQILIKEQLKNPTFLTLSEMKREQYKFLKSINNIEYFKLVLKKIDEDEKYGNVYKIQYKITKLQILDKEIIKEMINNEIRDYNYKYNKNWKITKLYYDNKNVENILELEYIKIKDNYVSKK